MYIKVNVIDLVISWVKSMIKGPLAFLKLLLVRSSEVLILLLLLELRIVYRTEHAHASKTSTNNKKQYTKQYKQYKRRLLNYSTQCNDRVSARIIENGPKTEKLWLKQDLRVKTQLNLIRRG